MSVDGEYYVETTDIHVLSTCNSLQQLCSVVLYVNTGYLSNQVREGSLPAVDWTCRLKQRTSFSESSIIITGLYCDI